LATRVANWHRDIKKANILVDNRGCIKLADFRASKKVVKLGMISEAKSVKGTPYWMALRSFVRRVITGQLIRGVLAAR
jgi:serine/threonine protein kinase